MKVVLVDAVFTLVSEKGELFEEMYQLLETLPNRKIVLTGANDEQFKAFGLDKAPYEVFTLKHNPEKSDPEYYRKILKHFGLKKEDVVYFEHDEGAVGSAREVGIETYHYDSEKRDLISLKNFLTENL